MDRTAATTALGSIDPTAERSFESATSSSECALDDDFWRNLERLFAWKRKHMPVLDTPPGAEVLIWLLKNATCVRPLKDLYRSSRFSEPTIRWILKTMVDDGFIVIDRNPHDLRVRTVRLTPKLASTVQEYLRLLRACVPADGSGPPGSGPSEQPGR
ncbi:MAG: MarR family winged helix-turn-helix transcriptional regulator [Proteobacteria bacterium]|nr:MarR family winged helix-turn-helix transcriptional regulator [Pseudomonadota bacterium]